MARVASPAQQAAADTGGRGPGQARQDDDAAGGARCHKTLVNPRGIVSRRTVDRVFGLPPTVLPSNSRRSRWVRSYPSKQGVSPAPRSRRGQGQPADRHRYTGSPVADIDRYLEHYRPILLIEEIAKVRLRAMHCGFERRYGNGFRLDREPHQETHEGGLLKAPVGRISSGIAPRRPSRQMIRSTPQISWIFPSIPHWRLPRSITSRRKPKREQVVFSHSRRLAR